MLGAFIIALLHSLEWRLLFAAAAVHMVAVNVVQHTPNILVVELSCSTVDMCHRTDGT